MNKQRFFIITTLFLLLLNTATLFFLWRNQRGEGRGRGNPETFIVDKLGLDKEQQAQFAMLRDEHQHALRLIRDEERRLHDAYFNLLKTNPVNRATVDSITSLIANQRKQTELAFFDHFAALRTICNLQQKEKLNLIIDEIGRRLTFGPPGPPPHP